MYILVKKSIQEKDNGHAVLNVAHATAVAFKKWSNDEEFKDWSENSFRKVLCLVTDNEFEKAKEYNDFKVVGECALGDNIEVSLVFKPRKEWPKFFKFLKLWS
jgi:hypothetical protein